MKIIAFKKYFASPTLAIALVCFILAGISFFAPKQKTATQTVKQHISNPTPSPVLNTETTLAPTEVVVTQIVYPTVTPLPTQNPSTSSGQATTTTTTTTTQSTNPQVAMTISEPDGTTNFTINFHDGMTACDSLTEAKNEEKIKSVTLQWYPSLNSNYVYEINGYKNNWTFTANGQSPMGCSLYTVSKGDNIVWKYD